MGTTPERQGREEGREEVREGWREEGKGVWGGLGCVGSVRDLQMAEAECLLVVSDVD